MRIEIVSENKSFGGWHRQYQHRSAVLNCTMRFAVYLPSHASDAAPVPVLYWLSGLTCTDENFMQKAGAHKLATELGIAIVCPDTSPRGEGVPDDPDGQYDLGLGAGFYVNATRQPWAENYQMYDYVVEELPALVESELPIRGHRSISGHSMGGHGALMIALRNPDRYQSVSAFSPIVHPVQCPWGQKAFSAYLGDDQEVWKPYDSCLLMEKAERIPPMRIDQGLADNFLETQLKPELIEQAAQLRGHQLELYRHAGYDHSYYFIASFIHDHLQFHKKYLDL